MNHALVRTVERLPDLNQSEFPDIPKQTKLFIPFNTVGRMETECILGIIVFVAALSNRWIPVSIEQFGKILNGTRYSFMRQTIAASAWELVRDGHAEIVRAPDESGKAMDYIVPTPAFVKMYFDDCTALARATG